MRQFPYREWKQFNEKSVVSPSMNSSFFQKTSSEENNRNMMKPNIKIIGAGLLTSIAASMCCITPVIAFIGGTSGLASTFSWIEPYRPYLIGLTILVLGIAWFQKLKRNKQIECNCDSVEKPKFIQSTLFLGISTIFAMIMLAFPYYSFVFYTNNKMQITHEDKSHIQQVEFRISGMTCEGCSKHINHEINQLTGIISSNASFELGNAIIEFDKSKTTVSEIEKAINSTGYSIINKKEY